MSACLWAEFDDSKSLIKEIRPFFVVGTGAPIPAETNAHLGSFKDGIFIWHIYD